MTEQATQTSIPNGTTSDEGESAVKAVAAQVEDAAEQLRDTASAAIEQGSAELKRAADGSAKFVRENPGLAVAGALGLGVLIGLSLRNRY